MFTNKTALITGSTSGIGEGIARALAAGGANIVLNGFGDAAQIEALRAEIATTHGVRVRYDGADMSKPEQIEAMIAAALKEFGAIDILVNNAGIQHVAPIDEFPAGQMGCDHRHQPVVGLPHHTPGVARDEAAWLGPHRQRRLGACAGGQSVQERLRGGQARHCRTDQDRGAGSRAGGDHRQRDLPRIRAHPAGGETDSRYREGARHHRGTGDQGRDAVGTAHQEVRHGGAGGGAGALPVQRRCSFDHRWHSADRWRLDRAVMRVPQRPAASPVAVAPFWEPNR